MVSYRKTCSVSGLIEPLLPVTSGVSSHWITLSIGSLDNSDVRLHKRSIQRRVAGWISSYYIWT